MRPLNELLRLERPLHVLDLETTGVDTTTARICEVGFQTWETTGLKHEWRSLVNPRVPIPVGASRVNHITDEDMLKCRRCGRYKEAHPTRIDCGATISREDSCTEFSPVPTFAQLAPRLATGFSNCDFAGKNVRYDLSVMAAEMARHAVPWSYAGAFVVDADRLEHLGDPRHLSHLYRKHLGREMEDAHRALSDVRATTEVIAAQLEAYKVLPRDVKLLHELQWPGWVDSGGKFRFDPEGVPRCQFGKHRGQDMRAIPQDYWRWILGADFSDEVKKIAADAMVGAWPSRGPQ